MLSGEQEWEPVDERPPLSLQKIQASWMAVPNIVEKKQIQDGPSL